MREILKRSILLLCAITLFAQPMFAAAKIRCSNVTTENNSKTGLPQFSATGVLDVNLLVQFVPGLTKELAKGDHWLEVRFYGPQGFLYESRMVPVTSDPAQVSQLKKFNGYRRPMERKLAKASKSKREIEINVPLPVAATSIVSSSMYGTWRAEVFVDGSDEPCAAPASFVITQ